MSLTPTQFWMEGGFFMYPVLLFGVMGILAAGASIFVREKVAARIALVLLLGCNLVGVAGMMFGRKRMEDALHSVSPEFRNRIREVGNRESLRPVQLGAALLGVGLPLALLGLSLGARRKPA